MSRTGIAKALIQPKQESLWTSSSDTGIEKASSGPTDKGSLPRHTISTSLLYVLQLRPPSLLIWELDQLYMTGAAPTRKTAVLRSGMARPFR